MATTYTKSVDVVTRVYDTVTHDQHIDHSGELFTPALSNVADAQAAGSYTATPVGFDGVIECVVVATDFAVHMPFAGKIIDAWAFKSAAGAAGDALAIKNPAGDAILTLDLSGADGARSTFTAAGCVNFNDDTKNTFTAGQEITLDVTVGAGGNPACVLFIRVKRTA